MSDFGENYATQLLVPAYVWADHKQRAAAVARSAGVLLQLIERDGKSVSDDVLDEAVVEPTFMKAVVGHMTQEGADAAFVAYDTCEMPEADLVWFTITVPVTS